MIINICGMECWLESPETSNHVSMLYFSTINRVYALASYLILDISATLQWIFLLFSGIKENNIAETDNKIDF